MKRYWVFCAKQLVQKNKRRMQHEIFKTLIAQFFIGVI